MFLIGFSSRQSVQEHVTKVHPEFLSEEEFRIQSDILAKRNELLKQKVLCNFCGKSLRKDVLAKHIKCVHLKIKDFGCDLCGSFLNSLILLKCLFIFQSF